jgi:hypothetical protein
LGDEYLTQKATSYDGLILAVRNKTPAGWSAWKYAYVVS